MRSISNQSELREKVILLEKQEELAHNNEHSFVTPLLEGWCWTKPANTYFLIRFVPWFLIEECFLNICSFSTDSLLNLDNKRTREERLLPELRFLIYKRK